MFGETKINDVAPIIRNDRTMLPARFVAENLGADVKWDNDTRKVKITKDDITIIITIDSQTALVNGKAIILDSPAFIENDRTYTPLRFVAEKLGADVEWNSETQGVIITK
ncbi:MAG: copper amine oxidase N-terminal domain-containing protein [Clostridiales bacterium]|nr:copper amine oxidase N-terminal domain-containing protein [Clostridiales bacterium]